MTKPSTPDDLAAALAELPLLPLPDTVLFPAALLTLEVGEKRHRALVQAALDRHGALAVAQPAIPPTAAATRPPLRPIAGVGTIVEHAPLSGSRDRLVVIGRARVKLQELSFVAPFRRALATVLPCPECQVPERELMAMHAAAAGFTALLRRREPDFRLRLPAGGSAGALADACADQLVVDPKQRQAALEALDVRMRVRLVTEVLTIQQATLGPEGQSTN
ncbi:MAG: LON peptidase substrate-binding domain-containing protein [Deltaproteobacteria bacterium]|nr:LON peptidase substrate-binding domain-containing protein [Deltaproteobacteria bacterium]